MLPSSVAGIPAKAVVFTRFADAVPHALKVLRRAHIGAVSLKLSEGTWWLADGKGACGPSLGRVGGSPGQLEKGATAVDIFRLDPQCRVIVLEAGASAAGLTLTCAQHVVFLDVLNSSLLEEQAAARVARIGQTVETTVWHLVADDSIDTLLRDVADRKVALEAGAHRPEDICVLLRRASQAAMSKLYADQD